MIDLNPIRCRVFNYLSDVTLDSILSDFAFSSVVMLLLSLYYHFHRNSLGSKVAGLAAAKRNRHCGLGVAYDSKIASKEMPIFLY